MRLCSAGYSSSSSCWVRPHAPSTSSLSCWIWATHILHPSLCWVGSARFLLRLVALDWAAAPQGVSLPVVVPNTPPPPAPPPRLAPTPPPPRLAPTPPPPTPPLPYLTPLPPPRLAPLPPPCLISSSSPCAAASTSCSYLSRPSPSSSSSSRAPPHPLSPPLPCSSSFHPLFGSFPPPRRRCGFRPSSSSFDRSSSLFRGVVSSRTQGYRHC